MKTKTQALLPLGMIALVLGLFLSIIASPFTLVNFLSGFFLGLSIPINGLGLLIIRNYSITR